jgi:hypothetical protein
VPAGTIRLERGAPTALELAAAIVVLDTVIAEATAMNAQKSAATPTAWQNSQRALRTTIFPGAGAWRGFSG